MVDVSGGIWVPHRAAVLEVWADQTPKGIALNGLGPRKRFEVFFNETKFALLTILLVCEFQERWFASVV